MLILIRKLQMRIKDFFIEVIEDGCYSTVLKASRDFSGFSHGSLIEYSFVTLALGKELLEKTDAVVKMGNFYFSKNY